MLAEFRKAYVFSKVAEVYRIRISRLESGRIQHILNKPDWTRTTVLFKFPDQDQDFQISFFGSWRQHNHKKIWQRCKILAKDVM